LATRCLVLRTSGRLVLFVSSCIRVERDLVVRLRDIATSQLTCSLGNEVTNAVVEDRKSTRLNSSHLVISYAVFCLKKKTNKQGHLPMRVEIAGCVECSELEHRLHSLTHFALRGPFYYGSHSLRATEYFAIFQVCDL